MELGCLIYWHLGLTAGHQQPPKEKYAYAIGWMLDGDDSTNLSFSLVKVTNPNLGVTVLCSLQLSCICTL